MADDTQATEMDLGDAGLEWASMIIGSQNTAELWASTLKKIVSSVVVLKVTQTRAIDTEAAGSSYATGFVVDKKLGLILTNRHVVTPGPTVAEAVFQNREEVPVMPVYFDPVHDFGFFRFDTSKLKFLQPEEVPLCPEAAAVGLDIRVVGNDSGEKISILSGTLARLDRDAPHYGRRHYNDFNTFYLQAASGTKGGSSGSPVVDVHGRAVALNAGGKTKAASAYYLPLHRPLRALEILRGCALPDGSWRAPIVPRGDLQATFIFKGFDEVKRLGLHPDTEVAARAAQQAQQAGASALDARAAGMLVVDSVVPGGPADGRLQPGDVLVKLNGSFTSEFLAMEELLDERVGGTVSVAVERGGEAVAAEIRVQDMHAVTPATFLELGGGSVHELSYQQARNNRSKVGQVYVAEPGYLLGKAGVPKHGIITALAGSPTATLEEFVAALRGLAHGQRVPLEYFTFDERFRRKNVILHVDWGWYGAPKLWQRNDAAGVWDPTVVWPDSLLEDEEERSAPMEQQGGRNEAAPPPSPRSPRASLASPSIQPSCAGRPPLPDGSAAAAARAGLGPLLQAPLPLKIPRQHSLPDVEASSDLEKMQAGVTAQGDDTRLAASPLSLTGRNGLENSGLGQAETAAGGSLIAPQEVQDGAAADEAAMEEDALQPQALNEVALGGEGEGDKMWAAAKQEGLVEQQRAGGAAAGASTGATTLDEGPAAWRTALEKRLRAAMVLVDVEIPLVALADGVHSRAFSGCGIIVHLSQRLGVVLVDRNTVSIGPGDVMLSFGAFPAEVPARVRFLHPLHNFALLSFDPAELSSDAASLVAAVNLRPDPLRRGDSVELVCLSKSLRILHRTSTVTNPTMAAMVAAADVPRFRAVHEEVTKLDQDFGVQYSGVLTDRSGAVRALWGSYAEQCDKEEREWTAGLATAFFQPWVAALVAALDSPNPAPTALAVRVLDAELEPLLLSKAAQFGLPAEWVSRLVALDTERRQVLRVRSTVAASSAQKVLKDGDMLLAVAGKPVSSYWDVECIIKSYAAPESGDNRPGTSAVAAEENGKGAARAANLSAGGGYTPGMSPSSAGMKAASAQLLPSVPLTIFRDKAVQEATVQLGCEDGLGTDRMVQWCGAQLQPPHRAVRELGFMPECSGVYVSRWHHGSPAHRFGLYALHWITEVNGQPTPDLDAFLAAVGGLKDGADVRVKMVHFETTREKVLTLKTDLRYFPTWELRLDAAQGQWRRVELGGPRST